MLILDLRWLLFALLAGLLGALAAGSWLARLRGPRPPAAAHGLAQAMRELEKAPFGLLLLRGAHGCQYSNAYARHLLGLPAPDAPLPQAGWAALLAGDCVAARQEGGSAGRYRSAAPLDGWPDGQQAPPGQRSARWWVAPLAGVELVLLLDATAQERAEESARTLLNDLSHELRTPLATILTHLEVLGLPDLPPETSRQSVALLKAEARRMARLVHQMLELGRLETSVDIERRPVDLAFLAEEAIAQMAPDAQERRVVMSLEAEAPLPHALGDGDRLRQVLLNLLDNAIKYCRPGDQVAVSLGRDPAGIRCSVRDSGPGIPAASLPHLGRRFYRAAPQEVEGSGLGLALVAEILRRHGSSLEIESRDEGPETGTSVRFVLPEVIL